jgi:hypothetical protein
VSETTLIAASSSGPSSAAMSTEVSSKTGTAYEDQGSVSSPAIALKVFVKRPTGRPETVIVISSPASALRRTSPT